MSTVKKEHNTTQVIHINRREQMKKLIISVLTALILVAVMVTPAIAQDNEANTTASASVSEYVSISLGGGIAFTGLNPGDTDVGADINPAVTITVEPETNVTVDIGIMGSTTDAIPLANWMFSTDFITTHTSLTGTYALAYDSVGDGAHDFYHWITVPADTPTGTYQATVYYKAVKEDTSLN
jgi:hypothetical protein